jgi:hypothetical protein
MSVVARDGPCLQQAAVAAIFFGGTGLARTMIFFPFFIMNLLCIGLPVSWNGHVYPNSKQVLIYYCKQHARKNGTREVKLDKDSVEKKRRKGVSFGTGE